MAVRLNFPDELLEVPGCRLATCAGALRYKDRDDLLLIELVEGSATAAVFTQSSFAAAPVLLAKKHLQVSQTRALLINAGNANAATGKQGLTNAFNCCERVAKNTGYAPEQVLPFSTGVIGEQFNMSDMQAAISNIAGFIGQASWLQAAQAIMTTDTLPKAISRVVSIESTDITITGICKGSGMICPDMATMLAFVVTDAPVDGDLLQALLEQGNARSFNCITVDSDTSTNDALTLSATGQATINPLSDPKDPRVAIFSEALNEVLTHLATSIIRDAEGATKFVTVEVINGQLKKDCEAVAYAVAQSPLVKTALFACDPNWGRLIMAIGKANTTAMDVERINIKINDVNLFENGQPAINYTEEKGQAVFSQEEIVIQIDLAQGEQAYRVWTSDLSHEYVSINADYRS